MQVKNLMRKNPATVSLNTPLSIVWDLLAHKQYHMLPVVDENKYLAGIITAEDLLKNIVPDYREFFEEFYPEAPTIEDIEDHIEKQTHLTAKDLMNTNVHTAAENMELFKALSILMTHHVRILPVIDNKSHIKGFIVEKDIFKFLFKAKHHLFNKLKKIKSSASQ